MQALRFLLWQVLRARALEDRAATGSSSWSWSWNGS